jgi:hypothetical protein
VFSLANPEFSLANPEFSLTDPEFSLAIPEFSLTDPEFSQAIPEFSFTDEEFSPSSSEFSPANQEFTSPFRIVLDDREDLLLRFKSLEQRMLQDKSIQSLGEPSGKEGLSLNMSGLAISSNLENLESSSPTDSFLDLYSVPKT